MRMRKVAAAMKQSSVQVSWVGLLPHGWSEEETKSKPSSSARIAVATGSAPGAAEVGMFSPNWIAFIARSFRRERLVRETGDRRQRGQQLHEAADEERVRQGADSDPCTEQPRCDEDCDADGDVRFAEGERGVPGEALVQYVPGREAQP